MSTFRGLKFQKQSYRTFVSFGDNLYHGHSRWQQAILYSKPTKTRLGVLFQSLMLMSTADTRPRVTSQSPEKAPKPTWPSLPQSESYPIKHFEAGREVVYNCDLRGQCLPLTLRLKRSKTRCLRGGRQHGERKEGKWGVRGRVQRVGINETDSKRTAKTGREASSQKGEGRKKGTE